MKVRSAEELVQGITNQGAANGAKIQGKRQRAEEIVEEQNLGFEGEERVDVAQSRDLLTILNPQSMQGERAQRVAELKKLVDSGQYFANRDITKIAAAVASGLEEEVSALGILAGDE